MEPPPVPQQPASDRPACDISKTQVMVDLFAIPHEQRDDLWRQSFLTNVPTASFACAEPQVLTGPDGFPYFILRTPEPMKPFESYCIQNMKDDFLLHNGYGIVINPTQQSADWVFSYGDIVNYHVRNEFYTERGIKDLQKEEIITVEEKILVGQPTETFLPSLTRNIIKSFLMKNGIAQPKVMLIARHMNGTVIQELVFNVFKDDYPASEHVDTLMRPISWLLPRHYTFVLLPKDSDLVKNFADL